MDRLHERAYIGKPQAQKILGVADTTLDVLISRGVLRGLSTAIGASGKKGVVLLERKEVERLRQEWQDLLPLDLVAQSYVGVGKVQVLDLAEAGLLYQTRGPLVDQSHKWFYRKGDIERFSAALLNCSAPVTPETGAWLSIPASTSTTGLSMAQTFVEVFNGRLKLVDLGVEGPLLQRFVLSKSELSDFLREREQRRSKTLGLLTLHEAAAYLSVDHKHLRRWVSLGIITGEYLVVNTARPRLFLHKEDLDVFRRSYVYGREAIELLNVSTFSVKRCIRQDVLHPVDRPYQRLDNPRLLSSQSVFLFRREEVISQGPRVLQMEEAALARAALREQMASERPEMSLTPLEVAERLRISRGYVYYLLRTGQLPYVQSSPERPIYILQTVLEGFRLPSANVRRAVSRASYPGEATDEQRVQLQPSLPPAQGGRWRTR